MVTEGFASPIRHILCRWLVFKNLKDNLRAKVPKDLYDEMLSELKIMMNVKEQTLFEDLCQGFLKKYEEEKQPSLPPT